MLTPLRIGLALIALLCAPLIYWVSKIIQVQVGSVVCTSSMPTSIGFFFGVIPVLVLILALVWAFRKLQPEKRVGRTSPTQLMEAPFKGASAAGRAARSTQFSSRGRTIRETETFVAPPPQLTWQQQGPEPLSGQFKAQSPKPIKKKRRKSRGYLDDF